MNLRCTRIYNREYYSALQALNDHQAVSESYENLCMMFLVENRSLRKTVLVESCHET